ncbi:nucleolar and coiled-body phosphoprotein 1-like isoform X2 [Betta splendens]|uniref:Nucleolar and coiled-body phosphoprotein 1-like isoform X2 n=1 Tax=Betta splendens TaxID=158456 RepID=A0A8M1HAV8_BETSP|nr:nucleolar and coiled-body phosphoprotein 1-like isoform X2 [Betta splendens]
MSLQVCHCGWSKVTTPHGLRIHQGRMGCTLKSARDAETPMTQQRCSWAAVELKYSQKELVLDGYASFKNDRADYYSDESLQVCHCGWSKVTTYQGLRIHQGKMGCTPKGMRIPKREQYDGRHMWGKEEEREKSQPIKRGIKQEMPQSPIVNICGATIKEEYNISVALSHYSSQRDIRPKVKRSDREHPPTHREAVVRPKEEKKAESRQMIRTCFLTDYAAAATRIKEEPESPSMMSLYLSQEAATSAKNHQLQDFSTDPLNLQVNHMYREAPAPAPAVSHEDKVRKERMLMQNASVPSRDILERAATIREERRQSFPNPHRSLPRLPDSESGRQLQDSSSEIRPAAAELQPKDKHGMDHNLSQDVHTSKKPNIQLHVAAEKEDSRPQTANEIPEPDASSGMTVTQLAQMFSANAGHEATGRPQGKHGEESKVVKPGKLNAPMFTAATAQKATSQPHKDRDKPQTSPATGTQSAESQRSSTATEDPKPSCETEPSSGFITGVRVKDLARWFSAAAQQETVQSNKKQEEEPKMSQVKLRPTTASSSAAQEIKACTEDKQVAKQTQTNGRPGQRGRDALKLELDLIFSEVVEVVQESQHKSHDLPLCSLRTATLAMMELIQQKLDKLSSVELKWFSKFSVDITLDPTTSHRCLVSADGLKVTAGRQNQEACDPGSSGGVLGLNSCSDRSYWEVEVSSRTGWDVGVASGNANQREKPALSPETRFWVVSHDENQEYAAVAAHASRLSLREKPQKVGVFVDYKEGRVSFYDVGAQSHIHSFTQCVFTGEVFPYFRVRPKQDGSAADPLTISPVKHH